MLTITTLLLVSCHRDETVVNSLKEEQFIDVYIALLENDAQSSGQMVGRDTSAHEVPRSILEKMGVSDEEFRATVRSYNAEPGRWREVYEKVTKRLEQKAQEQRVQKTPP